MSGLNLAVWKYKRWACTFWHSTCATNQSSYRMVCSCGIFSRPQCERRVYIVFRFFFRSTIFISCYLKCMQDDIMMLNWFSMCRKFYCSKSLKIDVSVLVAFNVAYKICEAICFIIYVWNVKQLYGLKHLNICICKLFSLKTGFPPKNHLHSHAIKHWITTFFFTFCHVDHTPFYIRVYLAKTKHRELDGWAKMAENFT